MKREIDVDDFVFAARQVAAEKSDWKLGFVWSGGKFSAAVPFDDAECDQFLVALAEKLNARIRGRRARTNGTRKP